MGISKDDILSKTGLLEQINTTADRSDYLWYSLRYTSLQIRKIFALTNVSVLLDNSSLVFFKALILRMIPVLKLSCTLNHLAMPFMHS